MKTKKHCTEQQKNVKRKKKKKKPYPYKTPHVHELNSLSLGKAMQIKNS